MRDPQLEGGGRAVPISTGCGEDPPGEAVMPQAGRRRTLQTAAFLLVDTMGFGEEEDQEYRELIL